jgi:mono/diheme cytochrome c family protein
MEQVDMKLIHGLAFSLALSLTVAAGVATRAQQTPTKRVSRQTSGKQSLATTRENEIERGRYLVNELARCSDCHTPRDSKGGLDRSAWLQGAAIWVMPVQSKETWAMRAPSLVGFPYSDQQAQDILERGIGTNGIPIQPPMHAYHLHHADAVAIIAYLRSLSYAK